MSADDGFRPLADPRYYDDDHAAADAGDADTHHVADEEADDQGGRHSWCGSTVPPPAPGASTPSPPGFLRVAGGILLIAIGAEFLLERLFGFDFEMTTLVLGLLLLAWWTRCGHFWAYVGGMITAGIGAGALLDSLVPGPIGGLLAGLCTAGGFALLATRPPQLKWAWWPAAIIAFFSVAGFGVAVATALFTGASASVLLPLSLVVAGGVLLSRRALSSGTRKALLIGCAVVFVLAASARTSDTIAPIAEWFSFETVPLDLDGRSLVVEAGSDAVALRTSDRAEVRARSARSIDVDPGAESVRVTLTRDGTVVVPPGTDVHIETTGSGDVDMDDFLWVEGSTVSITTHRGDVEADLLGNPVIEVDSASGDVEVDGREHEDGHQGVFGEGTPDVFITTGSGDVDVTRTAASEPAPA